MTITTCMAARLAILAASACTALSASAHAQLIYFEEDGGGGKPRGLYNLNPTTGVATLRTPVGGTLRFFGLCVQPGTGTVFAAAVPGNTGLYTIDINTGATTFIGNTGVDTIADIHFNPTTGKLYGVQRNSPFGIYEINPATAAATFLATTDASARCGMVIDAAGQAYGFAIGGPLSKLNLTTGATSLVGGSVVGTVLEDGDVTPTGEMYVTFFAGTIFRVDPATGASTLVHTTGMGNGLLGIISEPKAAACKADCSGDGKLDIADFTCFQNAFALGDLSKADVGGASGCTPDGQLSIIDFTCFQNLFALGCP